MEEEEEEEMYAYFSFLQCTPSIQFAPDSNTTEIPCHS